MKQLQHNIIMVCFDFVNVNPNYKSKTVCIYPNHLLYTGCDTSSIFEAEFNKFEFKVFFLLNQIVILRLKSPVCSYLPITGERIVGCIPNSGFGLVCWVLWHINLLWVISCQILFMYIYIKYI